MAKPAILAVDDDAAVVAAVVRDLRTGLGLDISRRIVVERHGGEIGVESAPGETVVRVRLPLGRDGDEGALWQQ